MPIRSKPCARCTKGNCIGPRVPHETGRAHRRPLAPYAAVHVLDEFVTGAGGAFEASTVEDPDLAAAVTDQLSFLQRARGHGDTDPPHSQHVPKEFVRKTEFVQLDTIARHEQPPGKARLYDVEAVARRGLGHLR